MGWFNALKMAKKLTQYLLGSAAIARGSPLSGFITLIPKSNPAAADCTITSVEIWANTNLTNCEVGVFQNVGTNQFTTRSSAYIGSVTSGSKQTFSVSMQCKAGDYIGIYYVGNIEAGDSGGTGLWAKSGDFIPCTAETFETYAMFDAYAVSLQAIGYG